MLENMFSFLFWSLLIGTIIYLIVKRIEDKKKEDFEDRDN
jgi:hypothetical protein